MTYLYSVINPPSSLSSLISIKHAHLKHIWIKHHSIPNTATAYLMYMTLTVTNSIPTGPVGEQNMVYEWEEGQKYSLTSVLLVPYLHVWSEQGDGRMISVAQIVYPQQTHSVINT